MLLRKNVKWEWGPSQDKAFKDSKVALLNSPVLTHYDPNLPIVVSADSSSYGIGAVLSHVIDGVERPCYFASRALSIAERNYSQLEKEALALVFALKKFHYFIWGQQFTLVSDHKPLLGIFSNDKQIPAIASGRIQRWSLMIQAYKFKLIHRSGAQMGTADALSRLPVGLPNESVPVPAEWIHLVNMLNLTPVTASHISRWTSSDPILSQVVSYCRDGWPHSVEPALLNYFSKRHELSLQHDCILWGNRIVVPKQGQISLLNELHSGHVGITRMKELARSYFWWPGIDADIDQMVKSCITCLENRTEPSKAELHPWDWPKSPWVRIHIDYAGPIDNTYFLVIVDAHSKWVEILPTTRITSEATVRMLRTCFARFGLPISIVSDNGPCFKSEEFSRFVTMNGIHHICTAPYRPSTNGLAENMVKTFKNYYKTSGGGNVQERLDKFLFRYRVIPHTTTGVSPSELMFSRKIRSVFDLLRPSEIVKNKVLQQQNKQKFHYDSVKPRKLELSLLDSVMIRNYGLGPKWIPGTVERQTGPISYRCQTSDGRLVRRHQDQVIDRSVQEPSNIDNKVQEDSKHMEVPKPFEPSTSETPDTSTGPRRSSRVSRPPNRLDL